MKNTKQFKIIQNNSRNTKKQHKKCKTKQKHVKTLKQTVKINENN